ALDVLPDGADSPERAHGHRGEDRPAHERLLAARVDAVHPGGEREVELARPGEGRRTLARHGPEDGAVPQRLDDVGELIAVFARASQEFSLQTRLAQTAAGALELQVADRGAALERGSHARAPVAV